MLRVAVGRVAYTSSVLPTVKLGPISTSSILSHTQIIDVPSLALQDLPIPINLTTRRAFGKKKKNYKAMEKMERKEKMERRRNELYQRELAMRNGRENDKYKKLRGDPTQPPPFIDILHEKGPDSWDSTGLQSWYYDTLYQYTMRKILEKNSHNKEYIMNLLKKIKENAGAYKVDSLKHQLQFEDSLQGFQYESRLAHAEALKNYLGSRFRGFTSPTAGMSNYPTIVPGVDKVFQMPISSGSVEKVKRGQVCIANNFYPFSYVLLMRLFFSSLFQFVTFILLQKPRLKKSPKDIRWVQHVNKRITALEGDIVDFEGREYTVPKGKSTKKSKAF